jgi:hypothetical protein
MCSAAGQARIPMSQQNVTAAAMLLINSKGRFKPKDKATKVHDKIRYIVIRVGVISCTSFFPKSTV